MYAAPGDDSLCTLCVAPKHDSARRTHEMSGCPYAARLARPTCHMRSLGAVRAPNNSPSSGLSRETPHPALSFLILAQLMGTPVSWQ